MPYPNFHSCRVRQPGEFQRGSFATIKRGRLELIIAKLKGKTTTTTQAYRYPKGKWNVSAARKHCRKHGGRFEAAKKT